MRFSLAPASDGKTLVGETKFEMLDKPLTLDAQVLTGWDPDQRQVRFIAFWSGALVEEIVLSRQRGTAFLGTYIAKSPGSPTLRERIRIDYKTPDSYVVTFAEGPRKDQELSSWKRVE
jgi:hypothetical protein